MNVAQLLSSEILKNSVKPSKIIEPKTPHPFPGPDLEEGTGI